MKTFWHQFKAPFSVLAPLEGVTDIVFRQLITQIGKPDVLFTEFTSCDGLQSNGRRRVEQNLRFLPNEQPIVAQIWGLKPENFYKTALEISGLGFKGIDLNMGCPDRKVLKNGAGAGLIRNHKLAKEIIHAVRKGSPDLPISIKTRIGYESEEIDEWIGFLLKQNIDALTIHLRTVKELSNVPAHWEFMPKIIQLRNKLAPDTIIIGNGDITSQEEIEDKYKNFGCDGFMIGRGIFVNPWIFNHSVKFEDINISKRFETYAGHIRLFEKTWGNTKNFANLKKFCKAYINNFPNASIYREKMMNSVSLNDLKEIVAAGSTVDKNKIG